MGKAKVIKPIGDEGLYQVQILYENQTDKIRYLEQQQVKIQEEIDRLQSETEEEISESLPDDPEEVDPDPIEDADPDEDDDPIFIPDPDPEPPEPDPPPGESGQISGILRGFI